MCLFHLVHIFICYQARIRQESVDPNLSLIEPNKNLKKIWQESGNLKLLLIKWRKKIQWNQFKTNIHIFILLWNNVDSIWSFKYHLRTYIVSRCTFSWTKYHTLCPLCNNCRVDIVIICTFDIESHLLARDLLFFLIVPCLA